MEKIFDVKCRECNFNKRTIICPESEIQEKAAIAHRMHSINCGHQSLEIKKAGVFNPARGTVYGILEESRPFD